MRLALAFCLTFIVFALILASFLLPLKSKDSWMPLHYEELSSNESPTIAVVGAGVIGLCTAYQTIKAIHECATGPRSRVVVIEAAEREFPATSSMNTGILSYTGFEKDLLGLAQYSYNQWEAYGRGDKQFKRDCGFREGMNIALIKKNLSEEHELTPDWIHFEPEWTAVKDPAHGKMAIINPVALGRWLYEQCLLHGVEFRMNTQAVSATLSGSNDLLSLDVLDEYKKSTALKADKLIIAAGPWTPATFKKLFPQSSVKFDPVISAGEWFIFENPEPLSKRSVGAVYLDEIVGQKLEFAGRNDHTIWATGEKSYFGEVPDLGHVPTPDLGSLAKLRNYSDTFLTRSHGPKQELRVIGSGRAYRPATETQLPIIASVPGCRLSGNRCENGKTGVYINSGHGSYGVTLGMGSGKLMSQIVLGRPTDLNVSKFGLSYDLD